VVYAESQPNHLDRVSILSEYPVSVCSSCAVICCSMPFVCYTLTAYPPCHCRSTILAKIQYCSPAWAFQGKIFTHAVGLAIVDPLAKCKHCSFIEGGFKFLKGSHDLDHPSFMGIFLLMGWTLPYSTHLPNLKSVYSFTHSTNTERVYNLQTDRYRNDTMQNADTVHRC